MALGEFSNGNSTPPPDETLTLKGEPADAKATGDALARKLDLTGGTMTGALSFHNAGDRILLSSNDIAGRDSLIEISNSGDNNDIGFGIGDGGKTAGIIHWRKSRWLIAEDIESGNVYIAGDKIFLNGHEDPYVVASGSGYVRFGDGTQICWGDAPAYSSIAPRTTSFQTVTFSAPFVDAGYGIEAGPTYDGGNTWMLHTFSLGRATSYAAIGLANGSTSDTVGAGTIYSYIAIGRWK